MKFNQPQVLLALFVTQSGLPVGYELFPGNTFEGNTLSVSLSKLKERYRIDQVVLVADRGMLSDNNLQFLQENNYQYIVGSKIRALDEYAQKQVLEWADSLEKENCVNEIYNRLVFIPQSKCHIKIFSNSLEDVELNKIDKKTYVLCKENIDWQLAIFENRQRDKIIPISDIFGLDSILFQVGEQGGKLSRQNKKAISDLISKHHNKPRTLVVSYRPARALKDRSDRERAVQKLQARLKRSKNPKQLISNYGFQKFVTVEGESNLKIDEKKLVDESRWDGIAGIYISDTTITNEEALSHYRGLWQVEESFRIQKHDLKIRPIYHWTPKRIQAHIAISFMAFVCVRYLEYRVATQSQKLSPKVIRDILMQYQGSIITDNSTNKTYLLPSKITAELKEIYRVLGLKPNRGLTEMQCSA